ncbi:MAG: pyrroloquinoline quinone biosynthesis protein PqqB [Bacteroidetes bacterium]|nr:pyrroloquinoline quinone biosynthesis protein PqqB [Bacteroidota bacterium]
MSFYLKILQVLLACLPLPSTTSSGFCEAESPFVVVLGIAQDAGYPQADCDKSCCKPAWEQPQFRRMVSCIAVIDPLSEQYWLVDATPDFAEQQHIAKHILPGKELNLAGIFLTHAHIGHYTGLMYLGREAIGANAVPVYAMPRMVDFLVENGPWSQLVSLKNIEIRNLQADSTVVLNERLKITLMRVPHRDEFSETVGFKIEGPSKSLLFIPDIDKWERWDRDINKQVGEVNFALLDGTFFKNGEIPGRDMSEIPHPFIEESLARFGQLPAMERAKIRFIHFNHTNPVMQGNSEAAQSVWKQGFGLASEGERLGL